MTSRQIAQSLAGIVALTLFASAVAHGEPRIKHSTVRVADQKVRVATRYHGHPDAKTTLLCLHRSPGSGAPHVYPLDSASPAHILNGS